MSERFIRPSVVHSGGGAIRPETRVNPGGHNTRRDDRIRLRREGVRCERADGRGTHRVLT